MSAPMSDEDEFWQAHYAAASLGPTLRVRLHLPYDAPPKPLNANWRGHWSARAKATAEVRAAVTVLAKQAGLHRLGDVEHVTVQLCWAPGDRRRRDAGNWSLLVKAAVDALARGPRRDLVGIDLVPDDTPAWLTELPTVILPPPAPKGMWLDLSIRLPRPDWPTEKTAQTDSPASNHPGSTTERGAARSPRSDALSPDWPPHGATCTTRSGVDR